MSRARDFADLAGSADAGGLTGRNVLINGNFDVWQRSTSFTDVAGIWKYGHADRWNGHNDGTDAGTWSQSTTVPNSGSKYSLLMTGATSVTNTNTSQRIESVNLQGIRAANSMTLSGYVRSETAGKVINLHGLCPTATDNYSSYTQHNNMFSSVTIDGDGTTGSSSITLTSADTWYYFTATKTSVTSLTNFDKGYALFCSIIGQDSSSEKVYFSQFQIEAGEQATPFEHEEIGTTLRKCQRYYFKFLEGNTKEIGVAWYYTAAHASFMLRYPTTMRATPTGIDSTGTGYYTIFRNGGSDAVNSITFENGSTEQYSAYNNSEASGTAGQAGLIRSTNASAKVEFDAEL